MITRLVIYSAVLVLIFLIAGPYFLIYRGYKTFYPRTPPIHRNIFKNRQFGNAPSSDGRTEAHNVRTAGYFRLCMSYNLSFVPKALAVGDINNDGKTEIVLLSAPDSVRKKNRLYIFTQKDGKLEKPKDYYLLKGDFQSAEIADVNGDGMNEIVAVDYSRTTLEIFFMQPSGDLMKLKGYAIPEPRDIRVADIDGDGLSDVILIKEDGPDKFITAVLKQECDGTLRKNNPVQFLTDLGTGEVINGIAVGSLYGQGKAKLIIAHSSKDASGVAISGFPEYKGNDLPPVMNKPYSKYVSLALSDVDADGLNDIAAVFDGLYIYLQKKDGSFDLPKLDLNIDPEVAVIRNGLGIGDVNGDGTKDIVMAVRHSKAIVGRIDVLCGQLQGK